MARVNVYSQPDPESYDNAEPLLLGWFDPQAATRYDQGREWDGNNLVGVVTGSQWVDEYLYRTAGGRWVLNRDATRYHNGPNAYRFLDDDEARDWLLRSEVNDTAVAEHFGSAEPERGPGRPEIGPQIKVRLTPQTIDIVDARAAAEGITRAAWIRKAVEVATA